MSNNSFQKVLLARENSIGIYIKPPRTNVQCAQNSIFFDTENSNDSITIE